MYVVAGATGQTGKAVAESLLARGKPVSVIVRDEARAASWKAKGARLVQAELEDESKLAGLLAGADGAYLLIPPIYSISNYVENRRRLAESIARAVEKSAIPHVVLLSSIAAHHASGTGIIVILHHAENAFSAAAKNLTVVRASYFLENWAPLLGSVRERGVLPTFLIQDREIPMVATQDIGTAAADALLGPPSGKRVIELSGPEDYSPNDIGRILATALGREVHVEHAPMSAVAPTFQSLGVSADVARLFAEMYAGINEGRVAFEGKGTEARRGTTPAAEVLRGLLRV